jgi:hypothetical protein
VRPLADVARRAGLSLSTLRRLIREGTGPRTLVGWCDAFYEHPDGRDEIDFVQACPGSVARGRSHRGDACRNLAKHAGGMEPQRRPAEPQLAPVASTSLTLELRFGWLILIQICRFLFRYTNLNFERFNHTRFKLPKARDALMDVGFVFFEQVGDDGKWDDQFAVSRNDELYSEETGLFWEMGEYKQFEEMCVG